MGVAGATEILNKWRGDVMPGGRFGRSPFGKKSVVKLAANGGRYSMRKWAVGNFLFR